MKKLKSEIEKVRSDMEVIEAIGIYDLNSASYIYKDKEFNFVDCFDNKNCFGVVDFIFWETDDSKLFIKYSSNTLVITQLDPYMFTNKVLLDLNIKRICGWL